MTVRSLIVVAILAASLSCTHETQELTRKHPITGTILAGETKSFSIKLQPNEIAHIALYQHEINLSLHAAGVDVDSSDWGAESAYFPFTDSIRINAPPNQTRQGRFHLRVLAIRPATEKDAIALRASRLDYDGHMDLNERSAAMLPAARRKLKAATELWAQVGDARREGNALHLYGIACERVGEYRAADAAYLHAISVLKPTGDLLAYEFARKSWMNLGGRLSEARGSLQAHQDQLAAARKTGDRRAIRSFVRAVGGAHRRAEALDNAIVLSYQELELARAMGDQSMEAEILVSLAAAEIARKNYSNANRMATGALQLARQTGDLSNEIAITGTLATICSYQRELAQQERLLRWLQKQHETRGDRTAWIWATGALAENQRAQGQYPEAMRLFVDLRHQINNTYGPDTPPAQYFTPAGNSNFVPSIALLAEIPAFTRQAFELIDSQRTRFFGRNPSDQSAALQEKLGAEAIFVEYAEQLQPNAPAHVFILDATSVVAIPVHSAPTFAKDINDLSASLANPSLTANSTMALRSRVANALLTPLKGRILNKKLVFVIREEFSAIPLALLPDPDHTDGSLLGDHHEVSYAPSGGAVLASNRPAAHFETDLLIAADPVTNLQDTRLATKNATPPQPADWTATARAAGLLVDGTQLPRLANATREVERLRSELTTRRLTPLIGFDADRARVLELLRGARFAHFISHGLANWDNPNASGLALSFWDRQGHPTDGFLRFDQISEARTDAKLITLAACETAIGRIIGGNGVPSLANAFLRAGAKRVVSSQWKVDDAATSELMVRFYKNLFSAAKPTPAQALWQAQMHVAAQPRWSRPYYWAGFTLTGDWRPL